MVADSMAVKPDTLRVNATDNFLVNGKGDAANWDHAPWVTIPSRSPRTNAYNTQVKILHSPTGIYCLLRCEDKKITATIQEDFKDLWNEDAVEVFFWPDETQTIYFEYELSPLNYELPILVPNLEGKFLGWRPWHYEGNRLTKHSVAINKKGDSVISWTAEFFIPFALLTPLQNVPPVIGSTWRANFYREDYDEGETNWQWQKVTNENFHDFRRFGYLLFK